MGLLATFFFLSIAFSFLCSILEAVLLSVTPAFIAVQDQEGSHLAKDLASFKADIDRPLAAILTLNTIAHTVGAIGVGSQATVLFGATTIEVFGVALISWEAMIAALMTLCVLIFSEVIPKTLGANNWEALAPFTVAALKVMLFCLAPLVWVSQYITRHLKKDKDKPVLNRADLLAMTRIGTDAGVIEKDEEKIIQNLLRFSRILAKDIMTPRIVVVAANDALTVREFHDKHADLPFSRIPLYHERNDNVTGYMLRDELLLHLVEDNDHVTLADIRRDILIVPKTLPIPELLNALISRRDHLALVVDEFGGMEGIVTMEDIIETLLGLEIVDESDNAEDMQALARKNWELRARRMGITVPKDLAEQIHVAGDSGSESIQPENDPDKAQRGESPEPDDDRDDAGNEKQSGNTAKHKDDKPGPTRS
ncbi:MAG: CNNM domain-containing protein [Pseudohongiellaceae bacterium]